MKYSFEELKERFVKDLMNEEPMYIVIKGHLYIEYGMQQLLDSSVANPKYMPNLSFSNKIKWLVTLGLIDKTTKTVLEAINKIRNNYAHELMLEITLDEIYDFIHKFSQKDQETIKKAIIDRGMEEHLQLNYALIFLFGKIAGTIEAREEIKALDPKRTLTYFY
ncbi:hypothetical protein CN917_28425 [Bacillus thuringiensis]|uniref:DUF4145 domain-containing protein n=1 Tax=Bacillus thuringiensis TaxID=1428 RepID=UPI000BFE21E4|nr:DUF4145 domain-containing protein [Bacillus thuringiensis]PGL15822.1 hypothetical protein CN917_28425 [Bacillus thuringiensis]PGT81816.1 hypothetical protein COD17_27220 [Bacillus thuringiensis]